MKDTAAYRIKISAIGPYRVLGGVPLVRRYPAKSVYGEPMEWDPVGTEDDAVTDPHIAAGLPYDLCRCGRSSMMPFCDDSHLQGDFDQGLPASRQPTSERREAWQEHGIQMTDDGSLCANAGFCGTRLTNVWEMIKRSDDPEVRARLLRMVQNCPSGRLEVSLGSGHLEPEFPPSIAVVPDGPLWVRGTIPIEAPDGFTYEIRNRVTLCRCGQSSNKPFCDGIHDEIGFKAS